jgi:hypothetical protein
LILTLDFRYEYLWADGDTIKKPIRVSAPEYVDYLMTWVQSILDDESIFPSRVGKLLFSLMNIYFPFLLTKKKYYNSFLLDYLRLFGFRFIC